MAQSTISSRTLRLARTAAILAVATVVAAACGGDGGGTGVDTEVTEVTVSAPSTTLEAGATLQLSAQAKNASGEPVSGKSFTWSSSSTAVADVSASGLVTGVTAGTVTITATEPGSGKAGTVTLNVTPAPVSAVTVSPATASITVGQTRLIGVELRDARGNALTGRAVTWTSSNGDVASVNASGLVTGVTAGGAVTITATSEGKSASAQVSVVPVPVAAVQVSPATVSVAVGATRQLMAVARDAAGNPLTGRAVTWTSADASRVSVSAGGLVTGLLAGATPVEITATVEGRTATVSVTVTPVPVASVTVSPPSATITRGSTQQLSATLRDAGGNTLTGRTVTWTSANPGVASVNSAGLVTGVAAGGPVTITASSEGRSASAQITVVAPTATRVTVTPSFATVNVSGTRALSAQAYDASGKQISGPSVTWSSGSTGVATVSTTGTVSGVAAGQAAISAQVNSAVDSAWVAVLAPNSLLSTAFAGGNVKPMVRPGQTFSVPVMLDLSRVSSNGDLGSVQFDLTYDPNVLIYQSAQVGVSGVAPFNVPTPGTFKFSFASTNVQGSSNLTLVTVTFRVAAGAPVGTQRAFGLTYTADPTSTSFVSYARPVAVGGRLRVVAP